MADILSRIILKAQGGDQAAREIKKIKTAYDEAGKSAKGLSAIATSAAKPSPFERAIVEKKSQELLSSRGLQSKIERQKAGDRLQNHLQTRSIGGLFQRSTQSVASGVTSLSQGNLTGVATGGVGAMGNLLGAAAGPYVAAAIAAIGAAGALAKQEYGRIQQTWQSGLSQQLGQNYTTTRNQIIAEGRKGIPLQNVTSMTSALAASGGSISGQYSPMLQDRKSVV